jgi:hypothetical protein
MSARGLHSAHVQFNIAARETPSPHEEPKALNPHALHGIGKGYTATLLDLPVNSTVLRATGMKLVNGEPVLPAKTVLNPKQLPNPMAAAGMWEVDDDCLIRDVVEEKAYPRAFVVLPNGDRELCRK